MFGAKAARVKFAKALAADVIASGSRAAGENACKARSRSKNISQRKRHVADSQVFGAHVWAELGPRLTDFQDKRLRLMDASGVEIMILSLNAPAVQAIPDRSARFVWRARRTTCSRQIAKRPDRFAGLAALPMQDPDEAARELDALREGARLRGCAGERLLAGRRSEQPSTTTCRNTGRSGAPSRNSTCRSTCTRAIRCPARSQLTRAQLAARPELGVPCRRPPCMRSA